MQAPCVVRLMCLSLWPVVVVMLCLLAPLCSADQLPSSSGTGAVGETVAVDGAADNLACLIKYGTIDSPDYCLCAAGVADNFACTYDCSCNSLGLQCQASSCRLSKRMIGLLVCAAFASIVGVCSCVVLCCYLARNRRRHTTYHIVHHDEARFVYAAPEQAPYHKPSPYRPNDF